MMNRPDIHLQAPAKLNLALSVGPKRADGMHPICSWMVALDLADDLRVVRLEDDRFSRYAILWHAEARKRSEIDWPITRDLAVRAHLALETHVGRKLPVQLKLDKRIPVGGGMGGGSSDAAAMLLAVNDLFDLRLRQDELAAIARTLGSDVSFFLEGGSAIVEGTGEQIERLAPPPPLHAAVTFPGFPCATGAVYQQFDTINPGPLRPDAVRRLASTFPVRPDALFNDLTTAAIRVAPDLARVLADVSALSERPAHLTGSGSTVFVLCDDSLHAQALASVIESRLNLPSASVSAG